MRLRFISELDLPNFTHSRRQTSNLKFSPFSTNSTPHYIKDLFSLPRCARMIPTFAANDRCARNPRSTGIPRIPGASFGIRQASAPGSFSVSLFRGLPRAQILGRASPKHFSRSRGSKEVFDGFMAVGPSFPAIGSRLLAVFFAADQLNVPGLGART
jgi:hypothetical protein